MSLIVQSTKLILIFIAVISTLLPGKIYAADTRTTVCVAISPQAFFVKKIGGQYVRIMVMVPPGASPATYEPKPRQLAALSQCTAYLAQGLPFESAWLERFKKSNPTMRIVRCYAGVERVTLESSFKKKINPQRRVLFPDPHIWLSPPLAIIEARNILRALVSQDPSRVKYYQDNYRQLVKRIVDLDLKIQNLFLQIGGHNTFLVYHPAWAYFAWTYGLQQVAIEKGGKKPLANDLKQLILLARKKGFKYLFIQPQISSHSAQVIANSIGAKLVIADPLARQWDTNLLAVAQKIRKALR